MSNNADISMFLSFLIPMPGRVIFFVIGWKRKSKWKR